MLKTCTRCHLEKDKDTKFSHAPAYKAYAEGINPVCKDCTNKKALNKKLEKWKVEDPFLYKIKLNPAPAGHKWCRLCNSIRPINQFYDKGIKGYKATYCMTCDASRDANRRTVDGHRYKYVKEEIDNLLIKQSGKCNSCDKALYKFDVDHIIPLSKGGKNEASNLQLLCRRCNLKKSNKIESNGPTGTDSLSQTA